MIIHICGALLRRQAQTAKKQLWSRCKSWHFWGVICLLCDKSWFSLSGHLRIKHCINCKKWNRKNWKWLHIFAVHWSSGQYRRQRSNCEAAAKVSPISGDPSQLERSFFPVWSSFSSTDYYMKTYERVMTIFGAIYHIIMASGSNRPGIYGET